MPDVTFVGVREFSQNVSYYLGRVSTGAVFVITNRGRPMGLLSEPPLPEVFEAEPDDWDER